MLRQTKMKEIPSKIIKNFKVNILLIHLLYGKLFEKEYQKTIAGKAANQIREKIQKIIDEKLKIQSEHPGSNSGSQSQNMK